MKIALTGTPGTGKTAVSEVLEKKGHDVINLNKLIFENKWDLGFDDEYESTVADLKKLNAYISEYDDEGKLHFFEGHLSHLLDLDMVIVLRTHPDELRQRLSTRDYPPAKIDENVEAEAMAVITTEALGRYTRVYEVNTTDISVEQAGDEVLKIIDDEAFAAEHEPGKFDWMDTIT